MFGRAAHFLTEEAEKWQIACWAWLLDQEDSVQAFLESELITPSSDFYPPLGKLEGHDRASAILSSVQRQCGLSQWPVELALQRDTSDYIDGALVQDERPCAGMFVLEEGGRAVISYDPALVRRPADLIATFAHELGHYYHTVFETLPPGGEQLIEPATDVTAAYFGFGIFGANACFTHENYATTSRVGKSGYLTEREWLFSLAIFLNLRGIPCEDAQKWLKSNLRKPLRKASDYLEKTGIAEPLRSKLS